MCCVKDSLQSDGSEQHLLYGADVRHLLTSAVGQWSLKAWTVCDCNDVRLKWGKHVKYQMKVDPSTKTMTGLVDGHPDEWLTAEFLENIPCTQTTESCPNRLQ